MIFNKIVIFSYVIHDEEKHKKVCRKRCPEGFLFRYLQKWEISGEKSGFRPLEMLLSPRGGGDPQFFAVFCDSPAGYLDAESIAREIGRPTDRRSVRRHRNNPPQSRSSMGERWANVENLFSVVNPKALSGKHILLVDDVLTTGATLASLASAILASVPDARISIATLAVSRKIDGAKSFNN